MTKALLDQKLQTLIFESSQSKQFTFSRVQISHVENAEAATRWCS